MPEFKKYLAMMNSRGITSVKEMGFDDFYGFTEALAELEQGQELTARVHFMSQPVGAPMNLEYGKSMRDKFQGDFVAFSGYNQMTDGSISQLEGEMKKPYLCADTCCAKDIDWEGLKRDALAADKEGFRFSLHAQGDGAIGKTVDIFEQCQRDENGKMKNRQAITDLECSDRSWPLCTVPCRGPGSRPYFPPPSPSPWPRWPCRRPWPWSCGWFTWDWLPCLSWR